MSTLRRQDTPGPGFQRIACSQVETAIRCLTRQAGQAAAANQAIGQARAILALVETELPRPQVRLERAIMCRLTAGLSEMIRTTRLLDELNRRHKKSPPDKELAAAVKSLRKRWSVQDPSAAAMSSKAGTFNPGIYRLVADMAELRGHLDNWPVAGVPADAPPRGLRRAYTKARRLAGEPIAPQSAPALLATLCELADQLTVLSKACPTLIKAHRKVITRAADALDNELLADALDEALLDALGKAGGKSLPKTKPLPQRIEDAVRRDLDAAFAESPAALTKRMQTYWSSWRHAGATDKR